MPQLSKILIIRFSSIGDIVLASPLIRALRATHPDAIIDFLVKTEYAELVKFNPHLSAVFELKSTSRDELQTLKEKIRREEYEVILDIHNSLRSRYVRMFSGAKAVRVVDKRPLPRFALVHFKKNFYGDVVSVAERYIETAQDFGVANDGLGLEVFVPEEAQSSVNALLSKYSLERFDVVLGLAPTANHYTKRWPAERFVEFGIQFAREYRTKILIFGGKGDVEYCNDIAHLINSEVGASTAVNLGGTLSLIETAATLDRCKIVVANDTGIMHLAAARKRKVVAIFGSTVREFGFFPYGTESTVLEQGGLTCRPCSHIGRAKCPEGHFKCMRDTSAANVVDAVQKLLQQKHEHSLQDR